MRWLLAFGLLLLGGCGYHLVGQGVSGVVPEGVTSASLHANSTPLAEALLLEFKALWQGNTHLPKLQDTRESGASHIVVRIEQSSETFSPIGFDASGLAVQYRLSITAALRMYRQHTLIWQAESVLVSARVFAGDDPSVVEAERVRLRRQLTRRWARQAMARLQSGF